MQVSVLLFAGLREAVGRDRLAVELPEGACVRDLCERLAGTHPALAGRSFAVAVNLEVVPRDRALAQGDEVSLLPPVGGGSPAGERELLELVAGPIDVPRLLAFVGDPSAGGVSLFLGTARDSHDGRSVVRLEYEAYPELALSTLRRIADEARSRVPDARKIAISHRTGVVPIGEASVAVAVSAPHRAESFEACRFAIDALKARAPIWKRERYREGDARWVENEEARDPA